jgi:hypothetical protein
MQRYSVNWMRIAPATSLPPHRRDHGVASSLFAVMLVPLVLVLAVVVDGGHVLMQRQQAQDAAEAGATLAGSTWQPGTKSANCVTSTMSSLVTENAGAGATTSCRWQGSSDAGRFDITVQRQVTTVFGRLLGRRAPTVTASASAEVGRAAAAGGLRPLGLCISHPGVPTSSPDGKTGGGGGGGGKKSSSPEPSGPTRILVDKDDGACGSASGNWGVLDLNGGSQSNSETQDWIENGYDGVVTGTVAGSVGIPSGSLRLETIVDPSNSDPNRIITIPLYRRIEGGGGSNAMFEVVSFIAVTVTDFKLSGSGRYIDVMFKTPQRPVYGTAGIGDANYRGVNSWRICALDDTATCR